jgi:hypothetical protein
LARRNGGYSEGIFKIVLFRPFHNSNIPFFQFARWQEEMAATRKEFSK